jgi:VanZ family protein
MMRNPRLPAVFAVALAATVLVQATTVEATWIPAPIRLHDHVVHGFVYGTLGLAIAWWTTTVLGGWRALRHLALVQLVILHVGLADEILQSTTPGREASPHDLAADCFGGFVGASLVLARRRTSAMRAGRGAIGVAYAGILLIAQDTRAAAPAEAWFTLPMAAAPVSPCRVPGADGVALRLDLGTSAARPALRDGWSVDERIGARTGVWTEGPRSRIEVQLAPGATPYRMELLGSGVRPPDSARPARATVIVNGHALAVIEVGPELERHELLVPSGVFHRGRNVIELAHAHTYTPPSDGRALSILLDEVCLAAAD